LKCANTFERLQRQQEKAIAFEDQTLVQGSIIKSIAFQEWKEKKKMQR